MFLFERSRLFLVVVAMPISTFFSQKENKQSSFISFASLSVFAFFLSFVSHERDLRFKEKSHLTHRHYIKHDS